MIKLENEKHQKFFNDIKAFKVDVNGGNYEVYYEENQKSPIWMRIEGLDEMIDFERSISEKIKKAEYDYLYGRYEKK